MQVRTTGEDGVFIVTVDGRIDANTVGDLRAVMDGVIAEGGERMVADFSGVEFLSSASLRMILVVLKKARSRGGDLRLACVRESVGKIFDLTGFAGILKFYPDVESAVKSYRTN